jgi:large subunit ribosomal protein L35
MPKMKTKKSAAKRFVVRPGGTVKRGQAFKRHILTICAVPRQFMSQI